MAIKNLFFNILLINILISYSISIDKEYLIEYFKAFLQKNLSNKDLLKVITLIRNLNTKTYEGNLEINLENFEKNHMEKIRRNKGYIEDQYMYFDMNFGIKTIADSGCGIIAVYNALYDLTGEENKNFPMLIDYFEKNGILLYGYFGTDPQAVDEYFKELGFETMSSCEKEEYVYIQENCDAFVLTLYNDIDDIREMIHTLNISKKNGKYFIHNNSFNSQLREYDSILDILEKINGGKSKDIYLTGIKKK